MHGGGNQSWGKRPDQFIPVVQFAQHARFHHCPGHRFDKQRNPAGSRHYVLLNLQGQGLSGNASHQKTRLIGIERRNFEFPAVRHIAPVHGRTGPDRADKKRRQIRLPRYEAVHEGMQNQSEGAQQISEAMWQLTEMGRQTSESVNDLNDVSTQLHEAVRILKERIIQIRSAE